MSKFVDWSELEVGRTYFVLGYHDFEKKFPKIETIVYAGTERDETGRNVLHIFKHPVDEDDIEDLSFLSSDPSCIGDLDCLLLELQEYRGRYEAK